MKYGCEPYSNYATVVIAAVQQELLPEGATGSDRLCPMFVCCTIRQMKSAYNFVPGVMGLILMLIVP